MPQNMPFDVLSDPRSSLHKVLSERVTTDSNYTLVHFPENPWENEIEIATEEQEPGGSNEQLALERHSSRSEYEFWTTAVFDILEGSIERPQSESIRYRLMSAPGDLGSFPLVMTLTDPVESTFVDLLGPVFGDTSPFAKIVELENAEKTRARLIEQLRISAIRLDGNTIADFVEILEASAVEEEIETDVGSLGQLVKFLLENGSLRTPDIVITNRGNYRAQWQRADNKHFAIEFFASGDAKYVCFRINSADPTKISRSSGTTTVDEVIESVMAPSASLDWIRE